MILVVLFLTFPLFGEPAGEASAGGGKDSKNFATRPAPSLVTDRKLERTGVQDVYYTPQSDFRTDFVMLYGINEDFAKRLELFKNAGHVLHLMTGVSWGDYRDYLDGKIDGRKHWDEGQVRESGSPVMHSGDVPYMVPTIAFTKYLEEGIRRAIDAGRGWPCISKSLSSGPSAVSAKRSNANGKSITTNRGNGPTRVATHSIAPAN